MKSCVLDCSVVLAILFDEAGSKNALGYVGHGLCCSVNVTEVIARLVDKGCDANDAASIFSGLGLGVVSFDENLGILAGQLRASTKHLGLSLGDRACLALGMREEAVVVTADRAWQDLDIDIEIKLIR